MKKLLIIEGDHNDADYFHFIRENCSEEYIKFIKREYDVWQKIMDCFKQHHKTHFDVLKESYKCEKNYNFDPELFEEILFFEYGFTFQEFELMMDFWDSLPSDEAGFRIHTINSIKVFEYNNSYDIRN